MGRRRSATSALLLALALGLPARADLQGSVPVPRAKFAAGASLCPGSFAFCADYEAASNACTAESPTPSAVAGEVSCDCTTSTNCINATRPAAIPQGTQVLEMSSETGTNFDLIDYFNSYDNADVSDSQYGRFCVNYATTDADATGNFLPLIIFDSDTGEWEGSGGFEAYLEVEFDGTPQIRANCPDDFGANPSTAIAFSANTWTEITWKTVESTGVMEVCVNAANGAGSCQSCDGNKAANTVQDGFSLYNHYDGTTANAQSVFIDAFRVQTSAFGATQGCSGL